MTGKLKARGRLPNKPSRILRVALADLEKCERSSKYKINMHVFHLRDKNDSVCSVCLAGSVMAQTLGLNSKPTRVIGNSHYTSSQDYSPSIEKKLDMLDEFRRGDVQEGLKVRGVPRRQIDSFLANTNVCNVEWVGYHTDAAQFKGQMRLLADELAANGL